jgi:hypothetical protein
MDELVKQISEKLGISQDAARKAVLVTAEYLKTKLPASLSEEIEMALGMENITEEEMAFIGLFKVP